MDDMSDLLLSPIASKHAMLALLGGIVHALMSYRSGETKSPADLLILSIISAFTGVIFALIAMHFFPGTYLTYASAGFGGFIGVEGMAYLTAFLKKKLKNLSK